MSVPDNSITNELLSIENIDFAYTIGVTASCLSGSVVVTGIFIPIFHKLHLPIQIVLLFYLLFIFLLSFNNKIAPYLNLISESHDQLILVTLVFPIIILKTFYALDFYLFRKCILQITLLVSVGFFVNSIFNGFCISYFVNSTPDIRTIIIGGMQASLIDVYDLKIKIEKHKHIEVLLFVECVAGLTINYISLAFFVEIQNNKDSLTDFLKLLVRQVIYPVIVGIVMGKFTPFFIRHLLSDQFCTLVFILAYVYISHVISHIIIGGSGIITTTIVTLFINYERRHFSTGMDGFVQTFINNIYYSTESLILFNICLPELYTIMKNPRLYLFLRAMLTYVSILGARFIAMLTISPMLSRSGNKFSMEAMFCMFWSGRKGYLSSFIENFVHHHDLHGPLDVYMCYTNISAMFLTHLINISTLKLIMLKLHLFALSRSQTMNIKSCFLYLNNRKARIINTVKMDRFYADANWSIITDFGKLVLPDVLNAEINVYVEQKYVDCVDCKKSIPVQATKHELNALRREINIRVLRTQKISFMRQYDQRCLNENELRILMQAIEVANNSDDKTIVINELLQKFREETIFHRLASFIMKFLNMRVNSIMPTKRIPRLCYNLIRIRAYKTFCYVLHVIHGILCLESVVHGGTVGGINIMFYINTVFFVFVGLIVIQVVARSHISMRHGLHLYLQSYWNVFEFVLCILVICNFISDLLKSLSPIDLNEFVVYGTLSKIANASQSTKYIFIIKLCRGLLPRVVVILEKIIDKNLIFHFSCATGMVASYDEVMLMLPTICDNQKIRSDIKHSMHANKLMILKEFAHLKGIRPWISTTLKTRQCLMVGLRAIELTIEELQNWGVSDAWETEDLYKSWDKLYTKTRNMKVIQSVNPKSFFNEIPWMVHDENVIGFLYENLSTRVWQAGDLICNIGRHPEGVYVVTAGYFEIHYKPYESGMSDLRNYGMIPVMDYLRLNCFEESIIEYVTVGMSMGELAVLTDRPYSARIVAVTPCQAFLLATPIIHEAMKMSKDPVDGLAARMWKYCFNGLVKSVLFETPLYQSISYDKIDFYLLDGFVPNLACYKTFVITDFIEDIILAEGIAVDAATRDIYVAPVYIPRTVTKLQFVREPERELTYSTKLFIIPATDFTMYEVIVKQQEVSDLVKDVSNSCLIDPSTVIMNKMINKRSWNANIKKMVSANSIHSSMLTSRLSFGSSTRSMNGYKTSMSSSNLRNGLSVREFKSNLTVQTSSQSVDSLMSSHISITTAESNDSLEGKELEQKKANLE